MTPTTPSNPLPEDASSRISTLLKRYAVAIAVVFLLQLFPVTGIFLMMLLAILWIGAIVQLFMLQVSVEALTWRMPMTMLVVPAAFYAAGIGLGLYSDVMAARWGASQEWLRIDKQIPADVHYVTFEPWNLIVGTSLDDPKGIFRPETLGFELIRIGRENVRLVMVDSPNDPQCRGQKLLKIGDRCFKAEPIERPAVFLRIGTFDWERDPGWSPPPNYFWGEIHKKPFNLVLHEHGGQDRVGRLQGATIDKPIYVIFPIAGCALISSRAAWECDWSFTLKLRQQFVGFWPSVNGASPDTPSLLMAALRQLRRDVPAAGNP